MKTTSKLLAEHQKAAIALGKRHAQLKLELERIECAASATPEGYYDSWRIQQEREQQRKFQ